MARVRHGYLPGSPAEREAVRLGIAAAEVAERRCGEVVFVDTRAQEAHARKVAAQRAARKRRDYDRACRRIQAEDRRAALVAERQAAGSMAFLANE